MTVPSLVAVTLDKLAVNPGDRILEIGAGTGHNGALLAHLTGSTGPVTIVDIDTDITAQARQALDAIGPRDHLRPHLTKIKIPLTPVDTRPPSMRIDTSCSTVRSA